ncbi:hypothetical protein DPMN_099935 [Dreissena polymorpha]|uniref:Uncharacterized protein n=1 Tax=Dreissena polymorpha TaxID=45954 RepID=A0A9D4LGJ9_DREPO|nr:hypothetical protein DPMN_099935 [Dreissena polymorpha]
MSLTCTLTSSLHLHSLYHRLNVYPKLSLQQPRSLPCTLPHFFHLQLFPLPLTCSSPSHSNLYLFHLPSSAPLSSPPHLHLSSSPLTCIYVYPPHCTSSIPPSPALLPSPPHLHLFPLPLTCTSRITLIYFYPPHLHLFHPSLTSTSALSLSSAPLPSPPNLHLFLLPLTYASSISPLPAPLLPLTHQHLCALPHMFLLTQTCISFKSSYMHHFPLHITCTSHLKSPPPRTALRHLHIFHLPLTFTSSVSLSAAPLHFPPHPHLFHLHSPSSPPISLQPTPL